MEDSTLTTSYLQLRLRICTAADRQGIHLQFMHWLPSSSSNWLVPHYIDLSLESKVSLLSRAVVGSTASSSSTAVSSSSSLKFVVGWEVININWSALWAVVSGTMNQSANSIGYLFSPPLHAPTWHQWWSGLLPDETFIIIIFHPPP